MVWYATLQPCGRHKTINNRFKTLKPWHRRLPAATDDYSVNVVENPGHVHDLQATILHLMGLDHERLTDKYQGRDFRLTDVHGRVVKDILAET